MNDESLLSGKSKKYQKEKGGLRLPFFDLVFRLQAKN